MSRKSWKTRLESLPLLLPNTMATEENSLEVKLRGGRTVLYATREYRPVIGPFIVVSISGLEVDVTRIREEIVAEMGEPDDQHENEEGTLFWSWRTGTDEMPESEIVQTIGKEKVEQACDDYRLSPVERRIVYDMLVVNHLPEKHQYTDLLMSKVPQARQELVYPALYEVMRLYRSRKSA